MGGEDRIKTECMFILTRISDAEREEAQTYHGFVCNVIAFTLLWGQNLVSRQIDANVITYNSICECHQQSCRKQNMDAEHLVNNPKADSLKSVNKKKPPMIGYWKLSVVESS